MDERFAEAFVIVEVSRSRNAFGNACLSSRTESFDWWVSNDANVFHLAWACTTKTHENCDDLVLPRGLRAGTRFDEWESRFRSHGFARGAKTRRGSLSKSRQEPMRIFWWYRLANNGDLTQAVQREEIRHLNAEALKRSDRRKKTRMSQHLPIEARITLRSNLRAVRVNTMEDAACVSP